MPRAESENAVGISGVREQQDLAGAVQPGRAKGRSAAATDDGSVRQGNIRTEGESERTHGSRQARLAKEPEALDIRAILRHEPEHSDNVRSIKCPNVEQERSGRPGVRAVD